MNHCMYDPSYDFTSCLTSQIMMTSSVISNKWSTNSLDSSLCVPCFCLRTFLIMHIPPLLKSASETDDVPSSGTNLNTVTNFTLNFRFNMHTHTKQFINTVFHNPINCSEKNGKYAPLEQYYMLYFKVSLLRCTYIFKY